MNTSAWTLAEAVKLCKEIEAICPKYGFHVALTGGCLYKEGERKDLDLIFYRIRQTTMTFGNWLNLWAALSSIGIEYNIDKKVPPQWRHVVCYCGKKIDCLFPENPNGDYRR